MQCQSLHLLQLGLSICPFKTFKHFISVRLLKPLLVTNRSTSNEFAVSLACKLITAVFLQQAYRTAGFISYGYMNFTRGAFLKHSKEFQNEDMAVDLTDKQCVVMGANQGIGFASAEALAARGATVHLVCRSKEKGEKAVEEIEAKTGNPNVSLEAHLCRKANERWQNNMRLQQWRRICAALGACLLWRV